MIIGVRGCSNNFVRFEEACKYCGYENVTDFTYNNNYNNIFSKITLVLVECDGDNIVSLYDGAHSTDKWGNKIIKEQDYVFCD